MNKLKANEPFLTGVIKTTKPDFNLNADFVENAYLEFNGKIYNAKEILQKIITLLEIKPCEK